MTAPPDDARAREISEQIRGLCVDLGGAFPLRTITALLTTALSEARDQGARGAVAECLRIAEDHGAYMAAARIAAVGSAPAPAIAPLREAVVAGLSKGFMTASAEYGAYFIEIRFKSMADMHACHSALIGLARADRAAQGAAAEERTP